ncbi:hypothetical protein AZ78_4160 [Lysobacter capsici AZ78]|uniref:Uncharacterized protein n=1 Tax=Lysobacter capsici AZ78 TaxID=1444315 RepID=A0A108UCU0_9GAMM|nr:hypothetical protein AZ78_4160 [Lysobacter capsici AZ78]
MNLQRAARCESRSHAAWLRWPSNSGRIPAENEKPPFGGFSGLGECSLSCA